jgi:hypothetical protein
MTQNKKREHIKVGQLKVVINVGEHTNKVHLDVVLSVEQEERLLRMLEQRKARRGRR